MSGLKPVAFNNPRRHEPRLSEPRVPGKHHKRFWTEAEDEAIRRHYPTGGIVACQPRLPEHHRSPTAIYQRARNLGLSRYGEAPHKRISVTVDFDDRLKAAWADLDGRKKGEVAALADQMGVPRWWLTKRATKLGLTIAHKKEPRWTAAEDELMRKVPLHSPDLCSRIFAEHGFSRTPTAIVVRSKRLDLSRRATRAEFSATKAAQLLGVDSKWVTAACLGGDLVATRREDQRRIQQGGSAWDIKPLDLRQFIIDHLDRIDIRKVDKFAFVDLLVNDGSAA